MSGHTPGPWSANYNGVYWQVDCENEQIGDVCASKHLDAGDNQEANARLIAAALTQHAELIACKQFLEDMHTQGVEWTIKESQVRHAAVSAAIAAATGETP